MVTQNIQVSEIWGSVIAGIGETTPPMLSAWAPMQWQRYADKALIAPRLQELYFTRSLIDIKLGSLSNQVSFSMSGDISLQLSLRQTILITRREDVCAEIKKLELWAQAVRAPVTEPIVATEIEPTPPPCSLPNPPPWDSNSPVHRGDPYWVDVNTEDRTW